LGGLTFLAGCAGGSGGGGLFTASSPGSATSQAAPPVQPMPSPQPASAAPTTASSNVGAIPSTSPNTISVSIVDSCQGGGNDCEYDTDEYRADLQNAISSALTARGKTVVSTGTAGQTLIVTVTALGENESDLASDLCGSLCDAASSQIASASYQLTDSTGRVIFRNSANASVSAVANVNLDALFQQLSSNIAASLP